MIKKKTSATSSVASSDTEKIEKSLLRRAEQVKTHLSDFEQVINEKEYQVSRNLTNNIETTYASMVVKDLTQDVLVALFNLIDIELPKIFPTMSISLYQTIIDHFDATKDQNKKRILQMSQKSNRFKLTHSSVVTHYLGVDTAQLNDSQRTSASAPNPSQGYYSILSSAGNDGLIAQLSPRSKTGSTNIRSEVFIPLIFTKVRTEYRDKHGNKCDSESGSKYGVYIEHISVVDLSTYPQLMHKEVQNHHRVWLKEIVKYAKDNSQLLLQSQHKNLVSTQSCGDLSARDIYESSPNKEMEKSSEMEMSNVTRFHQVEWDIEQLDKTISDRNSPNSSELRNFTGGKSGLSSHNGVSSIGTNQYGTALAVNKQFFPTEIEYCDTSRGFLEEQQQPPVKPIQFLEIQHNQVDLDESRSSAKDFRQKTSKNLMLRFQSTSNETVTDMHTMMTICSNCMQSCAKPIKLSWKGLHCGLPMTQTIKTTIGDQTTTSTTKSVKLLLDNATGYALPGQTTFLMGPSGAGKTTLLDSLTGCRRTAGSSVSGAIVLNDSLGVTQQNFNVIGGYVPQDEFLPEFMTVHEVITFTARLKLALLNRKEQDDRVEVLMKKLGLLKIKNSKIGGVGDKVLSKGEQRRITIGIELITDPSLLILDEPTSGLDSFSSYKMVKLLRQLAREEGKTVIATIHQPSSQQFDLFDRVIFMCQGTCIYQGLAAHTKYYLENQLKVPVERFNNPADTFLKLLAPLNIEVAEDQRKIKSLAQMYIDNQKQQVEEEDQCFILPKIKRIKKNPKPKFFAQLKILFGRYWLYQYRNFIVIRTRIITVIILALFMLSVFWNVADVETNNYQSLVGFYATAAYQTFGMTCITSIMVGQSLKKIFLRELYVNRFYNFLPHFIVLNVTDTIITTISSILFVSILYYGVGLRTDLYSVSSFFLVIWLAYQCGIAYAYLINQMFTKIEQVQNFITASLSPIVVLAGFQINIGQMNAVLKFLNLMNPMRYIVEGMVYIHYDREDSNETHPVIQRYHYDLGLGQAILRLTIFAIFMRVFAFMVMKLQFKLRTKVQME